MPLQGSGTYQLASEKMFNHNIQQKWTGIDEQKKKWNNIKNYLVLLINCNSIIIIIIGVWKGVKYKRK